jgi:hypothetical protein
MGEGAQMSALADDAFGYEIEPVRGIWEEREETFYPRWLVECRFTDKVMGGHPKQPDVLLGWLKTRFSKEEDIRRQLIEYVQLQGIDVSESVTIEEVWAQLKSFGSEQHGNGFHKDGRGLFIPARCAKAMIKEAANVRFPQGEVKWGTRTARKKDAGTNEMVESVTGGKAPKSVVAERVTVVGERIHLYHKDEAGAPVPVQVEDGTLLHVGHPKDRFGNTTSTLNYFDYCVQPFFSFVLRSHPDYPTEEDLVEILIKAQQIGLWAMRSQSYGQFKVIGFRRL